MLVGRKQCEAYASTLALSYIPCQPARLALRYWFSSVRRGDGALVTTSPTQLIILFIILFTGPLVGLAIERFGNRLIAIVGAVLSTTGLVLSAFSTQVTLFNILMQKKY